MNFLIMWLCTIILSLGMTAISSMKLIKDIADLGYKINMKEIDRLDRISNNSNNNILLSFLIPFYNIMFAMQVTLEYNNDKSTPINVLNVIGLLNEMNKEELEEYSKNPTLLNALYVSVVSNKEQDDLDKDLDLTNASYIKFEDDGSEVYFDTNDEFYDIIILKVTGPLSKLSKNKQLKKVREAYRQMQESIIENSKTSSIEEKSNSIGEQIETLKNMKEQLLNKDSKNIDNNNLKLIKKIKK